MNKRIIRRALALAATTSAAVLVAQHVNTNYYFIKKSAYKLDLDIKWSEAFHKGWEEGKRDSWCVCVKEHSPMCHVKEASTF